MCATHKQAVKQINDINYSELYVRYTNQNWQIPRIVSQKL